MLNLCRVNFKTQNTRSKVFLQRTYFSLIYLRFAVDKKNRIKIAILLAHLITYFPTLPFRFKQLCFLFSQHNHFAVDCSSSTKDLCFLRAANCPGGYYATFCRGMLRPYSQPRTLSYTKFRQERIPVIHLLFEKVPLSNTFAFSTSNS